MQNVDNRAARWDCYETPFLTEGSGGRESLGLLTKDTETRISIVTIIYTCWSVKNNKVTFLAVIFEKKTHKSMLS